MDRALYGEVLDRTRRRILVPTHEYGTDVHPDRRSDEHPPHGLDVFESGWS